MSFLALAIGIFLLIKGGDWLMRAAVSLSLRFSIPKIVIGMTVVSFATSAPELLVSLDAALGGYPDISLGNVIGSNLANIALVLGIIIICCNIGLMFVNEPQTTDRIERQKVEFCLESFYRSANSLVFQLNKRHITRNCLLYTSDAADE